MPQTLTIGAVLTAEDLAERLAETATQALIDEARLSPKPGLGRQPEFQRNLI